MVYPNTRPANVRNTACPEKWRFNQKRMDASVALGLLHSPEYHSCDAHSPRRFDLLPWRLGDCRVDSRRWIRDEFQRSPKQPTAEAAAKDRNVHPADPQRNRWRAHCESG